MNAHLWLFNYCTEEKQEVGAWFWNEATSCQTVVDGVAVTVGGVWVPEERISYGGACVRYSDENGFCFWQSNYVLLAFPTLVSFGGVMTLVSESLYTSPSFSNKHFSHCNSASKLSLNCKRFLMLWNLNFYC